MPDSSASPSSSVLTPPLAATINHLLAQEAWARDALARHAGKEAVIDVGSVALRLRAARDGMVEGSNGEGPANVTIRVKLSDVPLILQNRDRAFSYVQIEGDAEFANTISQLSKGLRWEAEADLEKLVGPIAAVRVAGGARTAFDTARTIHRKFAENVAEFLTEERPVLMKHAAIEDFGDQVTRLRDDIERTAKRIARIEQQLAQRARAGTPAGVSQQTLDLE